MHVERAAARPGCGKILGYVGDLHGHGGGAAAGDPAKALLIDAARETLQGDCLVTPNDQRTGDFMPQAPAGDVRGQIIAVVGGADLIGQYDIVAINRGARHGLERGTVLAIDVAGDTCSICIAAARTSATRARVGTSFAPNVQLPDERAGTLLVFKCSTG